MAQLAAPDRDDDAGILDPWNASDQPWWEKLDETVASDSDFIRSGDPSTSSFLRIGFAEVFDPGIHTGHIFRYRVRRNGGTGLTITAKVWHGGSVIETFAAHSGIGTSFTTFTETMSTGTAALITDYGDVRLELIAEMLDGLGTGAECSWMQFEVPDASLIDVTLFDALTFDMDPAPAKTVQPSLSDALGFSMLAPGLNDPERLIDAGRLFHVVRTRLSPGGRTALIDFEDV